MRETGDIMPEIYKMMLDRKLLDGVDDSVQNEIAKELIQILEKK